MVYKKYKILEMMNSHSVLKKKMLLPHQLKEKDDKHVFPLTFSFKVLRFFLVVTGDLQCNILEKIHKKMKTASQENVSS